MKRESLESVIISANMWCKALKMIFKLFTRSPGAVEYTDCFSAEG